MPTKSLYPLLSPRHLHYFSLFLAFFAFYRTESNRGRSARVAAKVKVATVSPIISSSPLSSPAIRNGDLEYSSEPLNTSNSSERDGDIHTRESGSGSASRGIAGSASYYSTSAGVHSPLCSTPSSIRKKRTSQTGDGNFTDVYDIYPAENFDCSGTSESMLSSKPLVRNLEDELILTSTITDCCFGFGVEGEGEGEGENVVEGNAHIITSLTLSNGSGKDGGGGGGGGGGAHIESSGGGENNAHNCGGNNGGSRNMGTSISGGGQSNASGVSEGSSGVSTGSPGVSDVSVNSRGYAPRSKYRRAVDMLRQNQVPIV